MTYEIDVYAAPHRLAAVHLVDVADGLHAQAVAAADVASAGAMFAEVFQCEPATGPVFYTLVPAAAGC
ncbi:hypothetical protein ACIA5A_06145 [Micromonospora sp. NPDC051300]|uniref:hypothetical protein n=1 Tax=Micromonospora sp. NPDC051300 TaxID=3364286 RepID=UPI0037BA9153